MYPFDDVPFLDPTVLGPPLAVVFGAYGAIKLGPPIVRGARQRAYDEASAAEAVRLVIAPTAALSADPGAATALIRALHPHQRRGLDPWRVGWPSVELRVLWRDGALSWKLVAGRQAATQARHALAARYPGVHIDIAEVGDRPAVATAVGRLTASSRWPLHAPEAGDAGALHGLAAALAAERPEAEVRTRLEQAPLRDSGPEAASARACGRGWSNLIRRGDVRLASGRWRLGHCPRGNRRGAGGDRRDRRRRICRLRMTHIPTYPRLPRLRRRSRAGAAPLLGAHRLGGVGRTARLRRCRGHDGARLTTERAGFAACSALDAVAPLAADLPLRGRRPLELGREPLEQPVDITK